MINFDNQTNIDINTDLIKAISSYLSDHEVELILTDNKTISNLNQTHRGKDYPTDVLSFPLEAPVPHMPLGTIVISIDFATTQAKQLNHKLEEEIALLFLHGMLHLIGFDHEIDDGEMAAKEIELATHFNLPQTLIRRTLGEN